jgi:predicted nucleic acid-binding protein
MHVLFDTSVLIASFLKRHEFHPKAARWLSAAHESFIDMHVSAHTLAELYSSLTSMPKPYRVPPGEAWQMIDTDLLRHARVRTLRASQYAKLIKRMSVEGHIGGVVYDAVIAEVAQRSKVDLLLTLNVPHFERVMIESGPRIVSPLDATPQDIANHFNGI